MQHGFQLSRGVIRQILPESIRARLVILRLLPLLSNYIYDFSKFFHWSATCRYKLSKDNLRARIIMDYHGIEKGLALRNPRPNFGVQLINRLLNNLQEYLNLFGQDELVAISLNCLLRYQEFNQGQGSVDPELTHTILRLRKQVNGSLQATDAGGTQVICRTEVLNAVNIDRINFFASRHSIRQFETIPVDESVIKQALHLAQHTPSVCNRQAWRVYVFGNTSLINEVLKYQNGNRGFGDQASHIIIVTCDLSYFVGIGERNQAWIDGGMYSMSLVYALHSLGLGTCCLNMSTEKGVDRQIRKVAHIRDSDVIIMMIAVGNLPNKFAVAQSPRFTVESIIREWVSEP